MAYILTSSSIVLCPHGGIVSHVPMTNSSFTINGELPMLLTDAYLAVGCPNVFGGVSFPCVNILWVNPSTLLFVRGIPTLTNFSVPIARDSYGSALGSGVIASFQTSYLEPAEFTNIV